MGKRIGDGNIKENEKKEKRKKEGRRRSERKIGGETLRKSERANREKRK